MDEIIALQAALAKAQLADTAHRISERTAVELVLKLVELKKVQLIFTSSGREYITPSHLIDEIEFELQSHGGRLTLMELPPLLHVDYHHIETAARGLVQRKKQIQELSGELITSYYLDQLVQEMNESLQELGVVSIVELAQRYHLPAEFMRTIVEARMETIMKGNAFLQDGQLYTQTFLQLHTARVRGILRACIKPMLLRPLITRYELMESRIHADITSLIAAGELSGSLKGVSDRAVYTPAIFAIAQQRGAESFFTNNGYLTYDMLQRLEIANTKVFLKEQYPNALQLQSLALSESMVNGCISGCEELLTSHLYLNAASILPNVLSRSEVEQVCNHALEVVKKQTAAAAAAAAATTSSSSTSSTSPSTVAETLLLLSEVWIVSSRFRDEAQKYAGKELGVWIDEDERKMDAALATAAAATGGLTIASSSSSSKESKKKSVASDSEDEEEESTNKKSKSKAVKKSASKSKHEESDEDDAPVTKSKDKKSKRGAAANSDDEETPAPKSKDKKKGKGKKGADSDEDDEPMPVKSKSKVVLASSTIKPSVLTRDRVQKWLKSNWNKIVQSVQQGNTEIQSADGVTDEHTDELITLLSTLILPTCLATQKQRMTARNAALAASSASSSSSSSAASSTPVMSMPDQAQRRAYLDTFRTALTEQYEQIQLYQHSIDAIESLIAQDDQPHRSRTDKTFVPSLQLHLQKTLVSQLIDLLIRMECFSGMTAAQLQQHGLDQMFTLIPIDATAAAAEKDAPSKPKYDITRTPLTQKERDTLLAALPKRSSESIKSLIDTSLPSVAIDKFQSLSKSFDLNVKPLDKKSERSRTFQLRKTLILAIGNETKSSVVLLEAVLLLFAKSQSVIVHLPVKSVNTLRRMLKQDMQPQAYAKLRRYNQLVMRQIRAESEESSSSSSSSSGVVSDEDDEADDDELPKDKQVQNMSLEDVTAELKGGLDVIKSMGLEPANALKAEVVSSKK